MTAWVKSAPNLKHCEFTDCPFLTPFSISWPGATYSDLPCKHQELKTAFLKMYNKLMKSKKNIAHLKQNFIADLFNLKEK